MIQTLTNQLIENISYFLLVSTNRVFYTLLTSISSTNIVFCGNSIGNKHWGSRQQYMVTISHTSIQITKLEFNQIHRQLDTQISLPSLHKVDKYMITWVIIVLPCLCSKEKIPNSYTIFKTQKPYVLKIKIRCYCWLLSIQVCANSHD